MTWNTNAPSCLKMMTSPIRKSCALANSFHPTVSLRLSILTFQLFSDASDLSFTVCRPSFRPSMYDEKNFTGMFCNKMQKSFRTKPSLSHISYLYTLRKKDRNRLRGGSRSREEEVGRSVGLLETEELDPPLLTTKHRIETSLRFSDFS